VFDVKQFIKNIFTKLQIQNDGNLKQVIKTHNYGKLFFCRILKIPHFSVKVLFQKKAHLVDKYPPFWLITWITPRK